MNEFQTTDYSWEYDNIMVHRQLLHPKALLNVIFVYKMFIWLFLQSFFVSFTNDNYTEQFVPLQDVNI